MRIVFYIVNGMDGVEMSVFAGQSDELRQAVLENGMVIKDVPEHFLTKEIVLAAVKQNTRAIDHAPKEMLNDKEFMIEAIHINPLCFPFASEGVRGDKEVVMAAVSKRGGMIIHASKEMKGDKEVVMTAVTNNPKVYLSISDELKADKDVILSVVSQKGDYLQYVPKGSITRDVVIFAMQNSTRAYNFVPEDLKDDPIIHDIIRKYLVTRTEANNRAYANGPSFSSLFRGGARTRSGKRKGTRRSKKRKGTIRK